MRRASPRVSAVALVAILSLSACRESAPVGATPAPSQDASAASASASVAPPASTASAPPTSTALAESDAGAPPTVSRYALPEALRADIMALGMEMVGPPPVKGAVKGAPAGPMRLYSHAFAGYALVNVALDGGSSAAEAIPLLDGIIARLTSPELSQPFGPERVTIAGHAIARSAAPLGHLALLLAARRKLAPLSADQTALLEALVTEIGSEITSSANHLLPTSGQRVWPADNEVIVAALDILEKGGYRRSTDASPKSQPLQELRGALAALEAGGLPPSGLAPDEKRGTDLPRGCALSWTVALRGLHDRSAARALYAKYRASYWVDAGPLSGLREWPPGVNRPADVDSGPIVKGVGAAATAFGIGAARLSGEPHDAEMLLATAKAGGLERRTTKGNPALWLERAIALFARTARPWS